LNILLALTLASFGILDDPKPKVIYIKAGQLFDGNSDTTLPDRVIQVEGERIKAVGSILEIPIPSGAEVIDLSKATVLPGLIDAHTHLGGRADRYDEIYKFKDTPNHSAFAAVLNAKKTLEAGFTTVRDVGSRPFLAVDLRDSIDEGFLVGPRIVASGPGISITGGHGDLNKFAPQVRVTMFPDEQDFKIADGIDQVRHVVRAQIKHGVDVIKVNASGGVLSRGDSPGAPQYSVEELRVLVEEAHAAGRKVAAHAHGAQGIKNAVIAGVDSIEHGSLIDDEGIKLMLERGTWLVADIYNDDYLLGKAVEFKLPQESIDKEKAIGQLQRDNFAKAVKAGVKVAYGTDAGVYPHGDNGKQFYYMVKYGLTPARAIRSATSDAAELLGKSQSVGKVVPGMYADLIAVAKDPIANIKALESVGFVMKGGSVVKNEFKPVNLSSRQVRVSPNIRRVPNSSNSWPQTISIPGASPASPR
jgi:imidazolonepropionase-like amidohydrolase